MARKRATLPARGVTAGPTRKPAARTGLWLYIGLGAAALGVVALIVWLAVRPVPSGEERPFQGKGQAAPGERISVQGQEHIQQGQTHPPYSSDPPTSGWHYPEDLPAGFYDDPYPDELLVHNLEHGHIVISYDCARLGDCEAVKKQLRALVDRYDNWKVVAVPRQNRDAAIALTAWGWIDKLDAFDERRMAAFVNARRDKGPERTAE